MRLRIVVPGPPEGKRRPRVDTRGGFPRVHATDADIKRERVIRDLAREAMDGRPPLSGPVAIWIEAIFEPPPSWSKAKRERAFLAFWHTSKPDKDNIEKSILDGLNPDRTAKNERDRLPFCLADDAQVADGGTRKRYGYPTRTEVVIETLTPGVPTPMGYELQSERAPGGRLL